MLVLLVVITGDLPGWRAIVVRLYSLPCRSLTGEGEMDRWPIYRVRIVYTEPAFQARLATAPDFYTIDYLIRDAGVGLLQHQLRRRLGTVHRIDRDSPPGRPLPGGMGDQLRRAGAPKSRERLASGGASAAPGRLARLTPVSAIVPPR
jgi:hypothetical protein